MNRSLAPLRIAVVACSLLAGCHSSEPVARDWAPDSIPDAYAHSVGALMWPGATRAYQVTSRGDLFNGAWQVRITAGTDSGEAAAPRVIASQERWCPVVRWTRRGDGIRWDFEAVALPEKAPGWLSNRGPVAKWEAHAWQDADRRALGATLHGLPESRVDSLLLHVRLPIEVESVDRSNLFVSLQVTATNESGAPRRTRLALTCAPHEVPPPFIAPDSGLAIPWSSCWDAASPRDAVLGRGDGLVRGAVLENAWTLAPGEVRSARTVIPAYPATPAEMNLWTQVPHEECAFLVRSYWESEVARGASFELGDPDVENAMRAARVLLLSLRERRTTDWVPIGGPFHYRDVWLRDGARAMQALALCGYTEEAQALARSFLRFQWPHGPFLSQSGQMDGTGQALWAFEQVMLRPAAAPHVGIFAHSALRAWRALERQRALGVRAGEVPGMLPATDPKDAELVRAQLVGNDAWAIAGYRATVRLLHAAHMDAEADSVERSLEGYELAFHAALDAAGRPDVPPSWRGAGVDWGNLAVAFPCGALQASDPHLDALAHRYWAPLGGAGLGWYGNPDSLHSYVAADLGTWALLARRREIADRVLDAALAWRSASGGWAEVFTRSGRDFGTNYPPHPTAAAAMIALVRNSLIYDDGDTLQLTLGARERWWSGSHVTQAPTRWGALDLAFESRGRVATWHWTKVPVWTELTMPPGTIAGVIQLPLRPGSRPDLVLAPPGTSIARVPLIAISRTPLATSPRSSGPRPDPRTALRARSS